MPYIILLLTILTAILSLVSCDTTGYKNAQTDFKATVARNNRAAYITSQCYTKTVDENSTVHNPCYTCHTASAPPNYINDYALQESYDMGEYSRSNRFDNLFRDRSDAVAGISDAAILSYIREDNYRKDGLITLAASLSSVPDAWDSNGNGKWDGYLPDCYFDFDAEGFDRNPDGEDTGWRAFGYYPFPGTFWPANGSTDDVLIRLPDPLREDAGGNTSRSVYRINLAIVESLIKESDVILEESVDETQYGVDLDHDGILGTAGKIVFVWEKPDFDTATGKLGNFSMSYVGRAKELLESNELLIAPGLYPQGTEFLHTVRYIDIDETNTTIRMAPRMKELRYARKVSWNSYSQLQNAALSEIKEKNGFPDRLRTIVGDTEHGLQNGLGWVFQGFIEDGSGELRPQNYEETLYCIGCHSGIGAIRDGTFVFARKFGTDHFRKGWYHWSQKNNGLKDIAEPLTPGGAYEYTTYLQANGAGDEFRGNEEIMQKFFDQEGKLLESEAEKIRTDISYLLYPSVKRALELNKAYKVIVDEQSFIHGRDPHVKPLVNVHTEVTPKASTMIKAAVY